MTTFYERAVVVHMSCAPLVLTLMADPGANIGAMLDAAPRLMQAAEPFQQAAEAAS